jgi:hypothetical protein
LGHQNCLRRPFPKTLAVICSSSSPHSLSTARRRTVKKERAVAIFQPEKKKTAPVPSPSPARALALGRARCHRGLWTGASVEPCLCPCTSEPVLRCPYPRGGGNCSARRRCCRWEGNLGRSPSLRPIRVRVLIQSRIRIPSFLPFLYDL